MKIEKVEKFVFNETEYSSLKEVKEVVENVIGEKVVDAITRKTPCSYQQKLDILAVLTSKPVRNLLLNYLNVKVEGEDGHYVNILDINV